MIVIIRTNVLILSHAMFAKKIEESKDDFTKKRLKRLNRVKDIMRQNVRELKRCLIMPVLRRTYILFTTLKAYFIFSISK